MLQTSEFILDGYAVSLRTGFLPETLPLVKLPDRLYEPWEDIASALPTLIQNGNIRQSIEALPVMSTANLQSESEWQRAYLMLAFFTHAYIWGGEKPKEILPPAISSPFLEISRHLELPPCATYAALVLWNYTAQSSEPDLTNADKLSLLCSFTGTKDEEWFYMISAALEARGAKLVPVMLSAIDAVKTNDSQRLASLLQDFAQGIHDLCLILERMSEKCAPPVFFHQLRPFLAGSKNMAAAGLPRGVFYDRGDGQGEWHQYSGGSNAQSSLIQALDLFLGIDHSATGELQANKTSQPSVKHPYLQEMRNYMPGPHRRFLELMARISNVRAYSLSHKAGSAVRDAYNEAALMLGVFRDKHIQIVSRYIIMAARTRPPIAESRQVNLATATSQMEDLRESNASGFYGTGGTVLIPFLKQTRDATKAAACYT
ncbi:hypothetical protein ASPZODRAFT_145235 [Penicilliopsis zonata CBS 506.65]|uniref:Indoleamine 2,3-dioxygenase n=1 Tax=Penicilliopsis zonata CBS 506.65 TaxID=1073090 RepID=A0A1L9SAB2_9EURO|nr:hypothetical protein ASPZODRAFT_145235 [Penicilliopsis zonata CBS 506.65]OJJ44122.1 hypothetical protein ASPZODRAFT_145235 [Penicilliopsis zonata CBS 506.65]